ncbi:MAG: hypothetical protein V7637_1089 [Mycobacteriales bacterium]|jgi:hypothetical protein
MDSRLPADVALLEETARKRFQRLGGVDVARRAESEPLRRDVAAGALAELGAGDLDVRADPDQLLAGAALCRAAGSVVLPWPVVGQLLRVEGRYLAMVDASCVRIDHGSVGVGWIAADLTGGAWLAGQGRPGVTGRLGPFVVAAGLDEPARPLDAGDRARYLILQAWLVLGALETAVADVVEHLRARRQFGHALADFQAIRFAMADVTVSLRGLEQLSKATTWRLGRGDEREGLADAMALRLHAADVAVATLRAAHQFYGALGFCDETDLSVIDRHLQPTLRYPLSAERIAQALVPFVRGRTLTGNIT